MCRFIEEEGKPEQVYGVLTDYDLSSWTNSMNPDYTKTSQQRTGTPPYMAHELLMGESPVHLYRHDIESLFYVMLLVSARHRIGTPEGQKQPRFLMRNSPRLPYQEWFNQQDYYTLGSLKYSFLSDEETIELSPDFEDFRPWLEDLQSRFSDGFKLKPNLKKRTRRERGLVKPATTVQFDDETLGGFITYATVLETVPQLGGALKGLVIRDPQVSLAPASSTPADAA